MDVLQSVTWSVTGAEQSQTYQNSSGTTTDWSGPVTHTWGGGSVGTDTVGFYWNATPGNHTVSVSVTYSDGSTGSASQTVSIAQPTVNSFKVNLGANSWQLGVNNGRDGFQGFFNWDASVTVPANNATGGPVGGNIAIIQKTSVDNHFTNQTNTGAKVDHAFNTGGFVLDNDPAYLNATDPGYLIIDSSTPVQPGATGVIPASVSDTVIASYLLAANEVGTLNVKESYQFIDYLVFRPSGGIWVELAETGTFTLSGDEVWNGPFNNTGSWQTISVAPNQAATVPGNPTLGFVAWQGWYANSSIMPPV